MKRYLPLLVFLLLIIICLPALAQTKGKILDPQGNPVAFANVVSLQPKDSVALAACLSREDGSFEFPEGTLVKLLRVNALGYETLYFNPAKTNGGAVPETLTITLKPLHSQQLREATVTARRPVARLEGDAIVTTVENTSLTEAGNAHDVLREVPGIIDKGGEDGSLEVIGKGKPVYYINGRQVRDLKELKQLRSTDIKQVEVVTTPGARYDASVNAVVRIRTIRRKGEGFGVSASEYFSQGKYTQSSTYVRLNYRKDALDVFASAGYNDSRWYWKSYCAQNTFIAPQEHWQFPLTQYAKSTEREIPFDFGLNYELAEGHTVGFKYSGTVTPSDYGGGSLNSDVLHNGVSEDYLTNVIDRDNDNDMKHTLNAYYVGKLGKGEFSFDADFFASGTKTVSSQNENSTQGEQRPPFQTVGEITNRLVAAKAQYEWPWLGGKVAVGSQYSQTNRHDDYFVDIDLPGVTPASSKQVERMAAGFVQYSAFLAKRYSLTAGVRFEHASYEYFENREKVKEQSPTYNNFFPSLSLSTAFGKGKNAVQVMAAYTVKTVRPSYSQLSNNVTYGNRFLLQGGNPNLRPSVLHDLTFTTIWKWLQVMATYNHDKDGLLWWGEALPENPEVTKVSYCNKTNDLVKLMVTASPKLGFFRPTWTVGFNQYFLKMTTASESRSFDNPQFFAVLVNNFVIPKDITLGVKYTFIGRGNAQNAQIIKPMHYLEASLSRSFLKKSLTVKLGVRDILYKQDCVRLFFENGFFEQEGNGDSRRFFLNLNYNFNAMRDRSKSKSEVENVINRM
ncbi:MAG: TonB-dependent receptor domain-containing protein [Alloprevotella sp.]